MSASLRWSKVNDGHAEHEREINARLEAKLAERLRIARELHDSLLPAFTGITLQLEAVANTVTDAPEVAARELTRLLVLADAKLRETRMMVNDLRSPQRDEHDLAAALEEAARSVNRGAVRMRYVVRGARRHLTESAELAVLRIGREAVSNAVRHANARTVDVELTFEPRAVRLAVCDDGRGASDNELDESFARGHWGVVGMRERAVDVGASLQITSRPGHGTTVSLSLPTDDDTLSM